MPRADKTNVTPDRGDPNTVVFELLDRGARIQLSCLWSQGELDRHQLPQCKSGELGCCRTERLD